jgi:hypothetical protein
VGNFKMMLDVDCVRREGGLEAVLCERPRSNQLFYSLQAYFSVKAEIQARNKD